MNSSALSKSLDDRVRDGSDCSAVDLQRKEGTEVVDRYEEVLVAVLSHTLDKYPAYVFPESLLPASKPEIARCLKSLWAEPGNEEDKKLLEARMGLLKQFVPDTEAYERNIVIIKQFEHDLELLIRARRAHSQASFD